MTTSLPSKHGRKTPVPLLLAEFPSPPTFIPPTPTSAAPTPSPNPRSSGSFNPPPSLPPSTPLPPIPGPSPITDLVFIAAKPRPHRGSRASTYSFSRGSSPSPSARDSTASFASGSSGPSTLPASPTASTFAPSARDRTESLTSASTRSIRSFPSTSSLSVPVASYHNHPPPPKTPPMPMRMSMDAAILEDEEYFAPRARPPADDHAAAGDDSLSSINMHDLPALHEDDGRAPSAQALHLEMRAARSKSETHRARLRRGSAPTIRRPSGASSSGHAPSAFPSRHSAASEPARAGSPDIASILAATPRPRRVSESSSARAASLPGSRRTSFARRKSGGSVARLSYADKEDDDWNEESFVEDYGVVIRGGDGGVFEEEIGIGVDEDVEAAEAAEDSDSSLDLHTPLPNLMLRDGMLSPHSKLLPQNLRAETPMENESGRPGSIMSVASTTMTKSGVYKDGRDTVKRRVRHRDGRTLRGGIGLTTGLGWSDSEDEDAPSPLTKRLSHLALSRKSSSSSLGPARPTRATPSPNPHPLSRSFSSDSAPTLVGRSPSGTRSKSKGRSSLPPTSWQKRAASASSAHPPLRVPTRYSEPPSPHQAAAELSASDTSTSTVSIGGPVTPDAHEALEEPPLTASEAWNRDKSLPPIPLSRGPSSASTGHRYPPALDLASNRHRSSRGSDSEDSFATPAARSASTTPARPTPRPLRLASALGGGAQPGEPTPRQGLLLGYNRQLHDQQRSAGRPQLPRAVSDGVSPRPRTGTGMVYKRSASALPSRMRAPSGALAL
ncbi:hypothetical protein FA95DRAFT_1606959 [Auriscalpium vulgare]|uniref:Uncharacterized protein n=1 Tax=Auriscalpium vulgare TaxID=40419 RepID=A0ACB8RQT9_9AGAM|nr:hypothetical protein FA95DRAFT_1606959 [Auriscalpium vulgare]